MKPSPLRTFEMSGRYRLERLTTSLRLEAEKVSVTLYYLGPSKDVGLLRASGCRSAVAEADRG